MKKTLLFTAASLLAVSAYNQDVAPVAGEATHKCGANEHMDEIFEEHPEWKIQQDLEQEEFQNFYEDYMMGWSADDRATYIIPVVIHIVHYGGPENISDEQVHDAIKQLNEDFSKTNEDNVEAISPFNAISSDMEIEFRLAGYDMEGNCTKGITRTYSDLTFDGGGGAVRDLVQATHGLWPQNMYMNVFVQSDIGGAAGYTNYPAGWYPVDGMSGGIYMLSTYMGSIGTSDEYREHTLSHEAGHWLNLKHLWGDSNNPTLASNCSDDDGVTDTPNTVGWDWCDMDGISCGSDDNVQNFLEYSYCGCMFTNGQKARVHAALNSSTAGRNNLWTASNLAATGTDGVLCEADFSADENLVCAGSTIQFTDDSYHQVTSWNWTFEGGTPGTSTDENPTVTYDTPGNYTVTLQAFNGTEDITETRVDYIAVFDQTGTPLPYIQDFQSITSLTTENSFSVVNHNDGEKFDLSPTYGYLSDRSAWLKNFGNDDGSIDELISETIDLSSVDPAEAVIFTFDLSYAKRNSNDDEELKIYISKDCGDTWVLRKVMDSDEMALLADESELVSSGPFFPSFDGWWNNHAITTITAPYYVENFQYKFEFSNSNGNNLFIDNINIYPASMTDIVKTEKDVIGLYPNPTNGMLTISGLDQGAYQILDMTGRVVQSDKFNSTINLESVANGVYNIVLANEDGEVVSVQRFIKE